MGARNTVPCPVLFWTAEGTVLSIQTYVFKVFGRNPGKGSWRANVNSRSTSYAHDAEYEEASCLNNNETSMLHLHFMKEHHIV